MANDLNTLMPVSASHGDYGLNDPANAWPGAGTDVVVNVSWLGTTLVQVGYNSENPDDIWARHRREGEQSLVGLGEPVGRDRAARTRSCAGCFLTRS